MWLTYLLSLAVAYLLLLRWRDGRVPPAALWHLLERPREEFQRASEGFLPIRGDAGEPDGWARALKEVLSSVRDQELRRLLREFAYLHDPTDTVQGYPAWPTGWGEQAPDWARLARLAAAAQRRVDELQIQRWSAIFRL